MLLEKVVAGASREADLPSKSIQVNDDSNAPNHLAHLIMECRYSSAAEGGFIVREAIRVAGVWEIGLRECPRQMTANERTAPMIWVVQEKQTRKPRLSRGLRRAKVIRLTAGPSALTVKFKLDAGFCAVSV
jgi:hypothetical protein